MDQDNPLGPPTSLGSKPEQQIANPQGPEASFGPTPAENPIGNSSIQTPQDQGKIQEDAHRIVTRSMELLHGPQTRDAILQALRSHANPVEALSTKSVEIMQKADQAARQAGEEIHYMSKMLAGKEVVDEIADLAENAGAKKVPQDQRDLAWTVAMQEYMKTEIGAGRLDPEELQRGVTESMKALDKDGLEEANQQMLRLDETASALKGTPTQTPKEAAMPNKGAM